MIIKTRGKYNYEKMYENNVEKKRIINTMIIINKTIIIVIIANMMIIIVINMVIIINVNIQCAI